MDQERSMTQITTNAKVTGETLLKLMWLAITNAAEKHQERKANKVYVGETPWQKFMATNGSKGFKEFATNNVNLDKFKAEMEKMGVGFSFHYHDNNQVTMAFNIKEASVVEKAFENIIHEATKNPEVAKDKYKLDPKNMRPEDKIKAYKTSSPADLSSIKKVIEKGGKQR